MTAGATAGTAIPEPGRERMRSHMSRRTFVVAGLSAAAAPALLGCKDATPPAPDPRLTARPGVPALTPALGLSALGLDAGRDGHLYVPAQHTPDVAMPLFVALHGAGGASDDWASYYARAEARGMILLAPDSRAQTWDLLVGGLGPDVAFLDRALAYTFDRCRVDPTRLVLAGFSDGASYALSLGVSNGDLFSHLVGYSPGFLQATSPLVGQPRIYVSHGVRDMILPVEISRDTIVPGLRDAGYDVVYDEFDGGHLVPAPVTEAVLDWFGV